VTSQAKLPATETEEVIAMMQAVCLKKKQTKSTRNVYDSKNTATELLIR
jgi:hypothetical protein